MRLRNHKTHLRLHELALRLRALLFLVELVVVELETSTSKTGRRPLLLAGLRLVDEFLR